MIETDPQRDIESGRSYRHIWDTAYVRRQERYSYFREGVCQAYFSCSPEKPSGRHIEARVEKIDLPKGCISKIDATPHRVVRTRTDIAKLPAEVVSLGLQLTGGLEGKLNGKAYSQKPGGMHLVDMNRVEGFQLDPKQIYSTEVLIFERSILDGLVRFDDFLRIEPSTNVALASCLTFINERHGAASQAEMTNLFDAALSLLIASLIIDRDYMEDRCDAETSTRSGLLHAVQDFMSRNLMDAELSTLSVADHFGISARYIQKLFAGHGMTFKSYLIGLRLAQVQRDLLNPSVAHVSASDIAFRWGFRDLTTFHRNFKRRFADTPSQMRSSIKAGARRP